MNTILSYFDIVRKEQQTIDIDVQQINTNNFHILASNEKALNTKRDNTVLRKVTKTQGSKTTCINDFIETPP